MFKDISLALETLMSRKNSEYGLKKFSECLTSLGNPQYDLSCIHVGGTNGKGSTTNYIRSGLQAAGYTVGSFTSPHLVVHNDRIRINDENISDEDFLYYINKSVPLWDAYGLSMFEIDMLVSIWYFLDRKVDYVVYEVGLGGTLDASNVILPRVSAITNVEMDHMNILGDNLIDIASQKAGIIKESIPVFTTELKAEVVDVFSTRCKDVNTILNRVKVPNYTKEGKNIYFNINGIDLNLYNQAVYQVSNVSLAVNVLQFLGIDDKSIVKGIENTSWAGRFEEIKDGIYLDGAHNLVGMRELVKSVEGLPRPLTVVFTALADKDYKPMVDLLSSHFDRVIITEFNFYRAESAENLAGSHDVEIVQDWKSALDIINNKDIVGTRFVTGSLYFVSDARDYLLK